MCFPFFKQQDNWDCSIACVAMVSEYFNKKKINYYNLIKKLNYYQDLNLLEIEELGKKLNLNLISYYVEWENFEKIKIKNPIICQIKKEKNFHFIVIYKKIKENYLVANPEKNKIELIKKEILKEKYTKIIITSNKKNFSINELIKENNKLNFLKKIITPIISLLIINIVITLLTIALQYLLKIIIDEVLIKKKWSEIFLIFFSFSLIFITNLIIKIIFEKIKFKIQIFYKKKWNLLFFQKIKLLNYINFKKYSLTTILKIYKYFNKIIDFYFPQSIDLLHNIFFILLLTIIVSIFNYWIIILIFIFLIMYLTIYIYIFPILKNIQNNKIENDKKFTKNFLNFIQNQNEFKRRNIDFIFNKKINNNFNKILKINNEKKTLLISIELIINLIKFSSKLSIIYLIIYLTSNKIKIGYFLFLTSISKSILDKSLNSFFFYNEWIKIKKLKKIINPFLKEQKINTKLIKLTNKNEIIIEDVNFNFNKNNFIWKNNLNIKINKNVLICGESGTGKTTLLQIICGELKETIGTIKINNKKKENSLTFQKEFFFISNKSKIFDGSVLENIFNFKNTKKNLEKFIKLKLKKWLKYFNLNIFNKIKNENLSNGQKQLIIFLSLFFNNSKIILLDECLNSIPNNIAKQLINFFIKKNKEKLILIVSHKKEIQKIFKNKIYLYEK